MPKANVVDKRTGKPISPPKKSTFASVYDEINLGLVLISLMFFLWHDIDT